MCVYILTPRNIGILVLLVDNIWSSVLDWISLFAMSWKFEYCTQISYDIL